MQKIGILLGRFISWITILVPIVFMMYPVLYVLLGSLKTNVELNLGSSVLPAVSQWENYYTAFARSNFLQYGKNSLIISLATMALIVIITSLSGYILARLDFVGKRLMMVSYGAMMFASIGSVTLLPIVQLLDKVGMSKSMLSLVLVLTGGQIANVFLAMGFVKGVSKELDEAARIDGCSILRIWWQIIVPLARPILGVVALFTFRNTWNDYITTLVLTMSNERLTTLTVTVVQLKYSMFAAAERHIMLADASLAIIPVLTLYFFTNRQFIAGLTAGAVKG